MSLFSHASSCPPPTRAALGAVSLSFSSLFSWRPPLALPALLSTRASPFPLPFFLHCLRSREAPPRLRTTPQGQTLALTLEHACHLQSRVETTEEPRPSHLEVSRGSVSGLRHSWEWTGCALESHDCPHVLLNCLEELARPQFCLGFCPHEGFTRR